MATIDIGKLAFTHKGDYAGGTAYVANDVDDTDHAANATDYYDGDVRDEYDNIVDDVYDCDAVVDDIDDDDV